MDTEGFVTIKEAMKKGEGKVKIRGWCYRERGSNKFRFIIVRDSSGIIQCVVPAQSPAWEEATKAKIECSLEVEGTIRKEEGRRADTR